MSSGRACDQAVIARARTPDQIADEIIDRMAEWYEPSRYVGGEFVEGADVDERALKAILIEIIERERKAHGRSIAA